MCKGIAGSLLSGKGVAADDDGEVPSDEDESIGSLNTPKASLSAHTFSNLTYNLIAPPNFRPVLLGKL